jgi:hypothetical protein
MTEQVSSGFFSSSGFEASDQVKNHGTRLVCISFAFRNNQWDVQSYPELTVS